MTGIECHQFNLRQPQITYRCGQEAPMFKLVRLGALQNQQLQLT